jgi:GT2 family glycosyltransferase
MPSYNTTKTVAVSIVTWNSAGEISECLSSLKDLPSNWEIWVIDNQSTDNTPEIVKSEFPHVNLIINDDNVGFAAANNQVILQTKTDYVLLLNPDTISEVAELEKLFAIAEQNDKIGIIGGKLEDEAGNVQVICEHFPYPWLNFVNGMGLYRFFSKNWRRDNLHGEFFDYESEGNVQWIVGAYLLVRREAIEKAGLIPEDYFMFAEAMHWCFLMWQNGFEVWYTSQSKIIHKMNRSARQLPSMWRIEKSTLCKYVFCYGEFGWLKTKFIEATDFMSYTFGIWRLMFRKPEPLDSETWKKNRQVVWQALKMGRELTSKKQLEKFTSLILGFMTYLWTL